MLLYKFMQLFNIWASNRFTLIMSAVVIRIFSQSDGGMLCYLMTTACTIFYLKPKFF